MVGTARIGVGNTAAFVIPIVQRLKTDSIEVGMGVFALSPRRELALQTTKIVTRFGRGTDLKVVLLVGGDSLEEQQFGYTAGNLDNICPLFFLPPSVNLEDFYI